MWPGCLQTSRLALLDPEQLLELVQAAQARRDRLTLFTLYVECGTECSASEPIESVCFEGDEVVDLATVIATKAGKANETAFVEKIQGAILVAFHNYKELRLRLGIDENNTFSTPVKYWYDWRSDSFKEPRMWEISPPRAKPLFQLAYEVESPASTDEEEAANSARLKSAVNVTIYEGDVAVEIGEKLAQHYEIKKQAGWDFAHYVATSYRKVRGRLEVSLGARPWEDKAPDGMALFSMDISGFAGVSKSAPALVVHEGDGPKALARQVLRHERQMACAVDKETCDVASLESEASAQFVGKVEAVATAITERFKNYFEH